MNVNAHQKIFEIVERVRSWPAHERVALARAILSTLEADLGPERPRRSLRDLVGLLDTGGPPLTDEDVERMKDEAIMERFGS